MFGFLKEKINGFTEKIKEKIFGEKQKEESKNIQEKKEIEEKIEKEQKEAQIVGQEFGLNLEKNEEELKQNEVREIVKEEEMEIEAEEEKAKENFEIKEEVREIEDLRKFDGVKGAKNFVGETKSFDIKSVYEDKRELKARIGLGAKVSGFIFGGIEIKEKEIEELLFELELSLIEADVEQEAARELVERIKQRIVGQRVSAKNIDEFLKEQIKQILEEMMKVEEVDLLEKVKKSKKPFKILIIGPNGAGKTTSIAKLARFFQKNNLSAIIAAADTFRAAAIDQLEVHANALGIRLIKQQYGADPGAVAFDAIKAAEANKIDVVIIDTAGRQETNKNLMEELRKIQRICGESFKIYVGEAYAGQGLLEQAKEFDEVAQGIDGFILTKIDADAKGGTTISLLYKMKKPVLFVGTGQSYDDFQKFEPRFILDRII